MNLRPIFLSLTLIGLPFLTSCGGGGGGGGGFVGAANVSVDASPTSIDTADRMQVQVFVSDVNKDGIALKLRFPDSLAYVPDSSRLVVDGADGDVTPTVSQSKDGKAYLVYYFSQSRFGEGLSGTLTIQLVGVSRVGEGLLEVDADVDDPAKDNATEFSIDTPEFEAQDQTSIQVTS